MSGGGSERLFRDSDQFSEASRILGVAARSGKLGGVLARVALLTAHPETDAFSAEEKEGMAAALGLEGEEGAVEKVEAAARYIFETAAFCGASGEHLAEELLTAGMDADTCAAARVAWDRAGKEVIAELRKATLGGPAEVKGVRFHTHVHLGHPGATNGTAPGATLELHVASTATGLRDTPAPVLASSEDAASSLASSAVAGPPTASVLSLDFSQTQLLSFLEQMDDVQRTLDSLGT